MADKFHNKYRIPSARHPNWDYGGNAAYFITICTKNRERLFGEIENQIMINSVLGNSASECWYAIPQHFPFVRLGAFVVMPNHVHGIVIIDKSRDGGDDCKDAKFCVFTAPPTFHHNKFGPQSQNLASVVRGYKIGVTKLARNGGDVRDCRDAKFCVSTDPYPGIIWQPRYHDHIIRNADEYVRIENYIINNPAHWAQDKFCNDQNHDG